MSRESGRHRPAAGRADDRCDRRDRDGRPGDTGRAGRQGQVVRRRSQAVGDVEVAPEQDGGRAGVAEGGVGIGQRDVEGPAAVDQPPALQLGQVELAGLERAQDGHVRQRPPARAYSARTKATSNAALWPTTVRPARRAFSSPMASANVGASRTSADEMPWTNVAPTEPPGLSRVVHSSTTRPERVGPHDGDLDHAIGVREQPGRLDVDDREPFGAGRPTAPPQPPYPVPHPHRTTVAPAG